MNTTMRAADASRQTDFLDRFGDIMIALLSAASIDDLLAVSRVGFDAALGSGSVARVTAAENGKLTSSNDDGSAFACIPLACDGVLQGAVIVGDGAPVDVLGSAETAWLAHCAGAAIATRRSDADNLTGQIKEASQLRFDVVSMLSHEMRTPLAAIKGYVSALLLDDVEWDSDVRTEFLQTIEAETDHLTALVTDVLDSAAMDAGEMRIEVGPVHVPEIARRVVGKLSIQTEIHRFVLSFPPSFPTITADAGRIEQVLTNLIDNAIKYAPGGGLVVIRGEVRPDEVIVSVIDQGIGIAPEDLNKLFERFFRASPDRRGRIGGTGLGLPIADSIIRAHGGRIWAESTIGSGTTLSFALPLTGNGAER